MKIFFGCIMMLVTSAIPGQEPQLRPLTQNDYAGWKAIQQEIISPDGKCAAFELNPQRGDGNLILRMLNSSVSDTFRRGNKASFGPGSSYLVFMIQPPFDSVMVAKRKKVKKDDLPGDSLGIYLTAKKQLFRYAGVKSFSVPEENGNWIAFLAKGVQKKDSAAKNKKPVKVDNLVLFNTSTTDTMMVIGVTSYHYAKKGNSILIVRELKDSTKTETSILLFNTNTGRPGEIFRKEGFAAKPVTDEEGTKYAFLFSADTGKVKSYSLYFGKDGMAEAEKIADGNTPGIPAGWMPSENGSLYFSQDAARLYFGTAPKPVTEPKDTLADEEKFNVDIWNWKDENIQPQQKVELEKEKKRNYLAVLHLTGNKFIQLADPNIRDVELVNKGNGDIALGTDNTLYRRSEGWDGSGVRDFYLVDVQTGIKRLIIRKKNYARLSPGGRYVVYYDQADSSYYSVSTDLNTPQPVALTKKIAIPFYNERHDSPSEPPPYGIAGWAPDDRFVYIYDRYDIWKIDPAGVRVPVAVTQTFGRRNQLQLRYFRLNREEEYIPSSSSVPVRAFSESSLMSGFYAVNFNSPVEPTLICMEKFAFSIPVKARKADFLLWNKENITDFPDLWVSDLSFNHRQKISDANPQQKNFIWPTVELVEWTSLSGEQLRGLLVKPGNLDPGKKYPMLVYFYERLSDNLYNYTSPAPSRSTINSTFYASNGYLVFMPDITYKTGYPGQSAYDAIMSGVYHLISRFPYVDKDRMGLQGQSWGGYQTAWLITQTDLFAAAMAGAPVSNMTSAYGGIRWESGISRMFQYEHTQSRIGGTLWEKPLLYLENSPLFHAPRIKTPLLIMANDNDGAVPWYQGIELFMALRRLDKPVWMLTYNSEPHNLKAESWANRMDLDKRMFQFFNHYLKNQPAPPWLDSGLPAIQKGKINGY